MTYATLMAHLELGQSNAKLLEVTGRLAERFKAAVIGIAACQPLNIEYGDGYVYGNIIEEDRAEKDKEAQAAEEEFRSALETRAAWLDWRAAVLFTSLADHVAQEARRADLVLTGVTSGSVLDGTRRMSTGDLVMQVGKPVLIVPAAVDRLDLERVVVGWKDTRETRRAISVALPLLKKVAHVAVVEIAAAENLAGARAHLEDVAGWLRRHGIEAETLAAPSTGDDAGQLSAIAGEQRADVIVAGAYGHNRLREWALGGVTRDRLLRADRCSLLSH